MSFYVRLQGTDVLEKSLIYAPAPSPPPKKKFCTNHGESAVQVVCLLFIVLFATDYTNQIKSDYLNSHGEEAQEKPPGL